MNRLPAFPRGHRSAARALWLTLAALLLSGTGVPLMSAADADAHASRHVTHHRSRHRHRRRHAAPGIPQHNGGDHDPDNNGARSDGDGAQ
jgi:hypothetical protein